MFIDFLSWSATQVFILALVIFGFSIYDENIRNTKIENAKRMKRHKNNDIREISPDNKVRMIFIVQPDIPNEMQIYKADTEKKIGITFTSRKTFRTLKSDLIDINFNGDIEFAHYNGAFQMRQVTKQNDEYNNIIEYVKDKCKMNMDECVIYQSNPIKSRLCIIYDNDKIISNKLHFNLDSAVRELIPSRAYFMSSLITMTICVLIKGLIYCFA